MQIKTFVFNPFYENTYVIWDENKTGFIIDPGCYELYEIEEITSFIDNQNIKIEAIINTHCHIDHVLGNYFMTQKYNCPLWVPENETSNYESVTAYAPQWGIHKYTKAEPDVLLKENQKCTIGNLSFSIIEAPGHSPGHQIFYFEKFGKLIGGDVLFKGSIGRTDLPGGDHDTLLENIKNKVYVLPEDTIVYPGHGEPTTVGHEKQYNPFVKG